MTTTMTTPPPVQAAAGGAAVVVTSPSTATTASGSEPQADAARRSARALHPAGRGRPGADLTPTGPSPVVDLASVRERSRPAHRAAGQEAGRTGMDGGGHAVDGVGSGAGSGDGTVVPLRARRPWRQWWHCVRRDGADAGMATAEYAVVLLAAVGFAGLLIVILTSSEIRELLTGLVRGALSV